MNNSFKDRQVLLTGASSGIGFELARLFLKEGAKVILLSADSERLMKAKDSLQKEFGIVCPFLVKDLSGSDAAQSVFEELKVRKAQVDILVNNAGLGFSGKLEAMDLEKCFRMVDVNVRSLVVLTKLFLPGMVVRGFGRILNVASTAGFQAVPTEAVYAASKAFVLHFTEALAEELKGTGVTATCLAPGPTDTPFFGEERVKLSTLMRRNLMSCPEVAEKGLRALQAGKTLVVPGFSNNLARFAARFVPRKWAAKIARKVVE